MTASIRGFSGKAKSTPSRRHRPIRQDAIGGQACNGLWAWGRSGSGPDAGTTRGRGMRVKAARITPLRRRDRFVPFFYFRARNRARSPSQPLASGAFPMSFAACGCDSPQRRRSKPIDRQPFKIRLLGRCFASRFRAPFCADAQCARLSVSTAPWGSYGRLPCETQMTGRLTRACSRRRLRRFDPAGRKKNRFGPNLGQAPPPSQPTQRLGAPAPIKKPNPS